MRIHKQLKCNIKSHFINIFTSCILELFYIKLPIKKYYFISARQSEFMLCKNLTILLYSLRHLLITEHPWAFPQLSGYHAVMWSRILVLANAL